MHFEARIRQFFPEGPRIDDNTFRMYSFFYLKLGLGAVLEEFSLIFYSDRKLSHPSVNL